jgi:FlaA1/EpsC-like NDP-sugar epimerase
LSVTGLLLDFYILISLVAGTRVSFHILRYLSRRELEGGRRLLIYGAGTDGVLMLQKILNDHTPKLIPVGFLDDDPQLEGKFVNGFPVFGGHWKLEGLLHKEKIHELLIADPALKPEIIRRLERTALQHGIVMERSRIQVKEMRLSGTPKKVQSVLAYADR